MMQLLLTLLGISLSAGMLFVGKSYLADVNVSRHSSVLERNIVDTTRAIERAFLECRRQNQCTTTSAAGTTLVTPSGTDTRPTEIRQLSALLAVNPSSADGLEYFARFTNSGKTLTVCILPKVVAGTAPFAQSYMAIAMERLGGPPSGTTPYASLTGFSYRYATTNPASYQTCSALTKNARPVGNYYVGGTRVFVDY